MSCQYHQRVRTSSYVHFLDLVVTHAKTKLLDSALDGVPASQPASETVELLAISEHEQCEHRGKKG